MSCRPSLVRGCSAVQLACSCFALRTVLWTLEVAGRQRASTAGIAEVDCHLHVVVLEDLPKPRRCW